MDKPNKRYFLSQEYLIEKILVRFNMEYVNQRLIPADPKVKWSSSMKQQSEGERSYSLNEAVGALLYLALQTRPDLAYAVCQVAKFCRNPQIEHWRALDQIFGYVKATKKFGIWIGGEKKGLTGFVDADFAGDNDDRKSTSGSIFFLNDGNTMHGQVRNSNAVLFTIQKLNIYFCMPRDKNSSVVELFDRRPHRRKS